MSNKTVIKFVAGFPPYNKGEIAGFDVEALGKIPSRVYELVTKDPETKEPVRVEVKGSQKKKKETKK